MNIIGMLKEYTTPKKTEWLDFNRTMFKGIQSLFDLGKKDGSINRDVDTEKGAYSFTFLTTGFFNQFAKTGKSFTESHNITENEFVSYVIELLGRALK